MFCFSHSNRFSALTVLLLFAAGCTAPDKHVPPTEHSQGPWTVKLNRGVYRYWLAMGPFHTSWLGTAAQFASIGEAAPEVEQVVFAAKAPTYSFDVEHGSGMKAHVRAGIEDTGEVQKLGFFELPKPGPMVGSVTRDGQLLGEIRFDGQSANSGTVPGFDEYRSGSIDCRTVGKLEIVGRQEQLPDSSDGFGEKLATGLDGLLSGTAPTLITEYRWKGQVVATMTETATTRITFESELPVEGQICIASAMAIRLAQVEFARQQQAAANWSAVSRLAAP